MYTFLKLIEAGSITRWKAVNYDVFNRMMQNMISSINFIIKSNTAGSSRIAVEWKYLFVIINVDLTMTSISFTV
jgi:hypothetical protein